MRGQQRGRMRKWFRDRWGWVVTAAGFLINMFIYNVLYCYGILLVRFQLEFNTNTVVTSWVGSSAIAVSCWSSIIANPLIERFGNCVVVVVGVLLSVISVLLTSFMPNLSIMYLTYSIMYGLGAGLSLMSSINLALKYFPDHNSTRSVTIVMAGANIGMLCTGPFLQYLVRTIGWRNSLRVMGAITLIVALPCTYVYDQPTSTKTMSSASRDEKKKTDETENDLEKAEKERFICEAVTDKRDPNPLGKSAINSNEGNEHLTKSNHEYHCLGDNYSQCNDPNILSTNLCSGDCALSSREQNGNGYSSLRSDYKGVEEGNSKVMPEELSVREGEEHTSLEDDGQGKRPTLFWRILVALTYPDVWLFCLSSVGYGACSSFFYVHMVSFMISKGFSEENGAQAIMTIGISVLAGKFLLSFVGDLVPFPKIFLFLEATFTGIALSLGLFHVSSMLGIFAIIIMMGLLVTCIEDTLPYSVCNQIFGVAKGLETLTLVTCFHGTGYLVASLFGKSIDLTGSYDGAIWATIIIFAASGIGIVLVPVYQRCFAKERYVMMANYHNRRCCCCCSHCCCTGGTVEEDGELQGGGEGKQVQPQSDACLVRHRCAHVNYNVASRTGEYPAISNVITPVTYDATSKNKSGYTIDLDTSV